MNVENIKADGQYWYLDRRQRPHAVRVITLTRRLESSDYMVKARSETDSDIRFIAVEDLFENPDQVRAAVNAKLEADLEMGRKSQTV